MCSVKFIVDSLDVSTRGKRRKAVKLVMAMLEKIRSAEESYLERIPLNLQSGEAYAVAEESVDTITDVILALWGIY